MADRVPYVIELITRKKPAEKFSINFYWKIDGGKVFPLLLQPSCRLGPTGSSPECSWREIAWQSRNQMLMCRHTKYLSPETHSPFKYISAAH